MIEKTFDLEVGWMDHDHSIVRPWPFKLVTRDLFEQLPESERKAIDESMLARCRDQGIVPRPPLPSSETSSPKRAA